MRQTEADVHEFDAQKSGLYGDRQRITAVENYILELWTNASLTPEPRVVINAHKRTDEGEYSQVGQAWFDAPDDVDFSELSGKELKDKAAEIEEEVTLPAANKAFDEMVADPETIEARVEQH